MIDFLKRVFSKEGSNSKSLLLNWSSQTMPPLPFLKYIESTKIPGELFIYLICKHIISFKIEDFFLSFLKKEFFLYKFEIISFYYRTYISQNKEKFFLAEMVVQIENIQDLSSIKKCLPFIFKEISRGILFPSYAKCLLESIFSPKEKVNQTYNFLFELSKRFPYRLDVDIFLEYNRFLILSSEEFRNQRCLNHIVRLICSHYLMGKNLFRLMRFFPEKRHLELRFTHTLLQYPFGSKPVLGLVIVIYLLDSHEFFGEKHILHATQKLLPDIQIVKGSFFSYQNAQEEILKSYVELEKKDGSRFSLKELVYLRVFLSTELKGAVEKLAPSMLMIQNIEEFLKNIAILSNELNQVNDLPQVFISFDEQTSNDLVFKVIIVRILRKKVKPLEQLFEKIKKDFKCSIQRSQIISYIRQKYPKEASILCIHIPKEYSILRTDLSINLYLARQKVVTFLEKNLGNIRDYNGGMILKQSQSLSAIQQYFKNIPKYKLELLEEFFYGISPAEMQAILPINSLVKLVRFFFESLEINFSRQEQYYYKAHEENQTIFVIIKVNKSSIQEHFESSMRLYKIDFKSVVLTKIQVESFFYLGFIYQDFLENNRQEFLKSIELGILKWFEKTQKQQILKLSFLNLPFRLDPRLCGEQFSGIIFKMLYEGLMRIGKDGNPTCAVAKSFSISKDLKKYTFKLRKCYWSNGSKITAQDFEYSWKKILNPDFKTVFAYLFYSIKNAKAAKEGIISCEEIGINAVNENTLVVDLEYPTPYFLELTAHAFYSPINHVLDKMHPNWPTQEGDSYVCNGPFRVKKIQPNKSYQFSKNNKYWDAKEVKLNSILISKANSYMALEMYQKDEIDWLGRPISPWEDFFFDSTEKFTQLGSPGIVYWCVLNTECIPFNHKKIRKALNLALNREEIIQSLGYQVLPTVTPVPFFHIHFENSFKENSTLARRLFSEGLQELKLERKKLPIFTFFHMMRKSRKRVAECIIKQWKEVLGIECRLESCDWSILFSKLTRGDYQIGEMSWFSPIDDSHYTLDAFKHKSNSINFSKWEDTNYKKLLELAANENNMTCRLNYLKSAEEYLIDQSFIIPLFSEPDLYRKKSYLKEVYQKTGQIDFKWAHIERDLSIKSFKELNVANPKNVMKMEKQNEQ